VPTYTGVTNFQKTVRFLLAHPVYMCFGKCVDRSVIFRMSNECVTLSGSGEWAIGHLTLSPPIPLLIFRMSNECVTLSGSGEWAKGHSV